MSIPTSNKAGDGERSIGSLLDQFGLAEPEAANLFGVGVRALRNWMHGTPLRRRQAHRLARAHEIFAPHFVPGDAAATRRALMTPTSGGVSAYRQALRELRGDGRMVSTDHPEH